MHKLGKWGNILGIIFMPFIALGMMIISPILLIILYINYRKEGN